MKKNSKIFIAGHKGLVGGEICTQLRAKGYSNIIVRSKNELDLRNQADTKKFFADNSIDYVILAAAKVGGISHNAAHPAEFIYDNLQIQNNVIHYAYKSNVKKLLFLGSACIYPKVTKQPIKEDSLLTSPLEPTNEAYALAKIAGLKMGQFYSQQYGFNVVSVMPANLYGPGDNFHLSNSHVIPALLRKFDTAKNSTSPEVICFGDGSPIREFLHVSDLADACIFIMNEYNSPEHINIGADTAICIKDLAYMIKDLVGFTGEIKWDTSKPNGTLVRKLDTTDLDRLGWTSTVNLKDGLEQTYKWFLESSDKDLRL